MIELLTRKFFAKDEEGQEREVEVWSLLPTSASLCSDNVVGDTLRLADTDELLSRNTPGVYSSAGGELFLCYDSDAP